MLSLYYGEEARNRRIPFDPPFILKCISLIDRKKNRISKNLMLSEETTSPKGYRCENRDVFMKNGLCCSFGFSNHVKAKELT